MSKKISLNNFLKMSPDVPEFSSKSEHYLIAGANPTYYLDSAGVQEEQVAPLIASLNWKQITTSLDGSVVAMCAGSQLNYVMTTTTKVYGIASNNTVTDLGYPSGSAVTMSSNDASMTWVSNQLYVVYDFGGSGSVYRHAGSSWTNISGPYGVSGTTLETFLEYCLINQGSAIKKIDSSYNLITGIDIGTGWNVSDIKNYNDKYVAIVGKLENYTGEYLFLWNGRSNTYNYSVKLAGKFIDMKVINCILYIAIALSSSKTSVFYLSGTTLKEVMTPQYAMIDTYNAFSQFVRGDCIFDYNNSLGLRLVSNSELTYPLMVNGNTLVGKSQFILSSGTQLNNFTIFNNGYLYASNGANIYYYPLTNTSCQPILYKSNWIPVHSPSGIDILYDTQPQSGTDAINVTVYGDGEDIIAGTSTTVLTSITPSTILNAKRTRLDLQGFTGDKMKIVLSTVNSSTWRPIIREVSVITE